MTQPPPFRFNPPAPAAPATGLPAASSYAPLRPSLKADRLSLPQLVMVTPEWAAAALAQNTINRKLKPPKIREYTEAILAGDWKVTHQGLCFYTTGDICDGQNRLEAIVRAGVPVPMLVTYGLPVEDGAVVDRGAPRTQADALNIGGGCGTVTPKAIALVKQTCRPFAYTTANLRDRLLQHADAYEFALGVFRGTTRKYLTSAPIMAAFALAHEAGVPEGLMREIAEVLLTGIMTRAEHRTVIKLREFLLTHASARVHGSVERDELVRRTQRAIRAVLKKESLAALYAPSQYIWPLFD